jgi:Na+-translocating ferredoxin:NAD+ oxidoreductase RnfC subunit
MDLLTAFTAMTSDLTAADASDRQIDGVADWEDHVREALRHATEMGASTECTTVAFLGASLHRTWRASCFAILRALRAQADEAAARRAENARARDEHARAAEESLARAEAAATPEDRGRHIAEAARHRDGQAAARERIRKLLNWETAAGDAHTFGGRILANEEPYARIVHDGIAQAGGRHEVPADKNYAREHRAGRERAA